MDDREKRLLDGLPPSARPDEREFYKNRIGELSEYERIKLEGALRLYPSEAAADVINLTYMLESFELLCGVQDEEDAQIYLEECGIPEEDLIYITAVKNNGENMTFTDSGCVVQMNFSQYGWEYYNGTNLSELRDTDFAVKLKLASAKRPEGTWLKLPCFDSGNGTLPAQHAAMDYLKVSSLDECTILDTGCVFPLITVNPSAYYDLNRLLEDAGSLGCLMDMPKDRRGTSPKGVKFCAVLEGMHGVTLADAVYIAENLEQCEIIASSAEEIGRNTAKKIHALNDLIKIGFDFKSYGNDVLKAAEACGSTAFTDTSYGVIRWKGKPFMGLQPMNPQDSAASPVWGQDKDSALRLVLRCGGKKLEGPLPISPNTIPSVLRELSAGSLEECSMQIIDHHFSKLDGFEVSPSELEYAGELEKLLRQFGESEWEKYRAVLEYEEEFKTLEDITDYLNCACNLGCYEFYPSKIIKDEEDYGRYIVQKAGQMIPDEFEEFFHYEELGEEYRTNQGGVFVTGGYVYSNDNTFHIVYAPRERDETPGMRL